MMVRGEIAQKPGGGGHEARGKTFLLVIPSPVPLSRISTIAPVALMNNAGQIPDGNQTEDFV